jgi:hypothetical protein
MIMTNKLLPVALVAALIGGSVGAFVMHSKNDTSAQPLTAQSTLQGTDAQYAKYQANGSYVPAEFNTASEQSAYKNGFADGFRSCEGAAAAAVNSSGFQNSQPRVVYRNTSTAGRSYARSSSAPRRVYYDYQQPKGRSFWQKHRDKLTVAMGTGGGALIGGLIGGKKGAAIGALGGAGGSALYTYKLRNRNRRY